MTYKVLIIGGAIYIIASVVGMPFLSDALSDIFADSAEKLPWFWGITFWNLLTGFLIVGFGKIVEQTERNTRALESIEEAVRYQVFGERAEEIQLAKVKKTSKMFGKSANEKD